MYRKPSSSCSRWNSSAMVMEMLAMLRWFTSKKKAWLGLSCMRRLSAKINKGMRTAVYWKLAKMGQTSYIQTNKSAALFSTNADKEPRLICYLNILMSSATVTWSGTRNLVLSKRGRFFSPAKRSTMMGILFGCSSLTISASLTLWPASHIEQGKPWNQSKTTTILSQYATHHRFCVL